MKKSIFTLLSFLAWTFIFGQGIPAIYYEHIKNAESLYLAKEYRKSAENYSEAFKSNGWKGTSTDRYNAACTWALAGEPDSAFFQLERIALRGNYTNYNHLVSDPDLNSLHDDGRWKTILDIVKQNKEKAEVNFNKPLVAILDTIYMDDQKYRMQIDGIDAQYGWQSKEMQDLWNIIDTKDSINLVKVKSILDQYGWLGPDVIGAQGNSTLFLVIQHSDQATQEKYLPMMREAVKNGKAQGSSLALLEDRVALGQGRMQIYGSQIGRDKETGQYYVLPLDDPDNVDIRRAEVGLSPLSDYLMNWNMVWDAEQYKKDLPAIEQREKEKRK